MPIYIKVKAEATIKIQDPYDNETLAEAKDLTYISCPFEMIEEDYNFEIVDAD